MAKNRARYSCAMKQMPLLIAALLFAGLFARISMLAQLSQCSKQISLLEDELVRGEKEIAQKELLISEMQDLRRIALRASELGMTGPTEEQLRVLQTGAFRKVVPMQENSDTSAKQQP